jgi:hypothetical protein
LKDKEIKRKGYCGKIIIKGIFYNHKCTNQCIKCDLTTFDWCDPYITEEMETDIAFKILNIPDEVLKKVYKIKKRLEEF